MQYLYKDSYTVEQAVLNAGFLLAYLIILVLQKRDLPDKEGRNAQTKQVFRILLFVFLMILCVTETSINANETGYSTTDRVAYTEDNADIEELLDSVDDGSFFRVEKAKRRTKNDGAWSDYRSASVFSSTTLKGLSKIYASLGMQSGTNSFSYYGNTPFTSALLGVKYKLSDSAIDDPMWEYVKGTEKAFLYQAKYVLPLGFMVKNTTQAEVNPDGSDPFLIQNNLINAACGAGPVFQIKGTLSGERIELEIEEDVRKLIYIQDKLDNLKVDVYRNGSLYINRNFTALECKLIVDLGEFQKGDRLVIYTTDSEKSSISLIEADLDKQAFAAAMEAMGSNPWVITEAKDGFLKGTVQAQAPKMTLFTTIPDEKGWSIYVDGEKTAYKGFYNAFIQIPLEKEGMHEVEMIYRAPGLIPGLIISAAALILFIILCLIKKKKQSKKSLK